MFDSILILVTVVSIYYSRLQVLEERKYTIDTLKLQREDDLRMSVIPLHRIDLGFKSVKGDFVEIEFILENIGKGCSNNVLLEVQENIGANEIITILEPKKKDAAILNLDLNILLENMKLGKEDYYIQLQYQDMYSNLYIQKINLKLRLMRLCEHGSKYSIYTELKFSNYKKLSTNNPLAVDNEVHKYSVITNKYSSFSELCKKRNCEHFVNHTLYSEMNEIVKCFVRGNSPLEVVGAISYPVDLISVSRNKINGIYCIETSTEECVYLIEYNVSYNFKNKKYKLINTKVLIKRNEKIEKIDKKMRSKIFFLLIRSNKIRVYYSKKGINNKSHIISTNIREREV